MSGEGWVAKGFCSYLLLTDLLASQKREVGFGLQVFCRGENGKSAPPGVARSLHFKSGMAVPVYDFAFLSGSAMEVGTVWLGLLGWGLRAGFSARLDDRIR